MRGKTEHRLVLLSVDRFLDSIIKYRERDGVMRKVKEKAEVRMKVVAAWSMKVSQMPDMTAAPKEVKAKERGQMEPQGMASPVKVVDRVPEVSRVVVLVPVKVKMQVVDGCSEREEWIIVKDLGAMEMIREGAAAAVGVAVAAVEEMQ